MAKRPLLETFVSPVGEAIFPYLINPDVRHNADGIFKTDLALTPEEAAPFIERLEGALDKFFKEELNTTQQKTLAHRPVYTPELTRPEYPEGATDEEKAEIRANFEPEETGRLLFRFKMNKQFTNKKGDVITQQPIVVSAETGERVTENIWTGSKIRVKGQIVPYVNNAGQYAGLSLRMKSVQVIELVVGSGGDAAFWTDFGEDDEAAA